MNSAEIWCCDVQLNVSSEFNFGTWYVTIALRGLQTEYYWFS